jgi:alpha-D-ribose 1-methylphosphonate 5-triphosphate diphosphatase PhnM
MLLLDRLEPDKGRQVKFLTDHSTRQRVLPSLEEELLHQLELKAKREVERQQTAEEKAKHRAAAEQQATYAHTSGHRSEFWALGQRSGIGCGSHNGKSVEGKGESNGKSIDINVRCLNHESIG